MDWQQEYNDKRISTDQAVEQIIDINNLILGMSMAMPPGLLEALGRGFREDRLPPLNIYYMHGSEAIEKHLLVEDLIGKFTPPLSVSQRP